MPRRKHRHIKYQAKIVRGGVEVKILEQTHRGHTFIPRGNAFNSGDCIIGSWSGPSLMWGHKGYGSAVSLRGSIGALDNRVLKFENLETYARFKAAVVAYNEKYKVDGN